MSDFMAWILSILGVVIIGSILEIFLSEKKMGKLIRSVFASLLVLVIITPLPSLLGGSQGCTGLTGGTEVRLDDSFLGYANSQKVRALELGLIEALAERGYKNVRAEITAEIGTEVEITLVRLYLADLVMGKSDANINKTETVRSLAAELLSISKEKVMVMD